MSRRLKGLTGEELPAVLFAVILLFIFIFLVLNSYTDFFLKANVVELDRTANSWASGIFARTGGIISDPDALVLEGGKNRMITIMDTERGLNWTGGYMEEGLKHMAVGSVAVLIYSQGLDEYYTGRVVVNVG